MPHLKALVFGLLLAIASSTAAAPVAARDQRLVDAARQNDPAAIKSLLQQKVDVDARQADGATALLWVTYHNNTATALDLLNAGADVTIANTYGETPLSLACENGNAALVNRYLAAGADAAAVKPLGDTMLMIAARSGEPEIIKALVAHGAAVNAKEPSEHQTALMAAVAHRHAAVVELLLKAGADVNARTKRGSTALHFAVQQTDVAIAKQLIAAGADLRARMTVRQIDSTTLGLVETLEGLTPLLMTITDCRRDGIEYFGSTTALPMALSCPALEEIGSLLLDHGADANDTDGSKIPALHQAVHAGMPTVVRSLLAHGADVNARVPADARQWQGPARNGARAIAPMPIGATPLFVAAWWHRPEIMQALLDAGADPSIPADDKTTPLMAVAGVAGRPPMGFFRNLDTPKMLESVRILMARNNDVNAVNAEGQTPMHGAAQLGSKELIQLLADSGAKIDVADKKGQTPLALAKTAKPDIYKEADKEIVDLLTRLGSQSAGARE